MIAAIGLRIFALTDGLYCGWFSVG